MTPWAQAFHGELRRQLAAAADSQRAAAMAAYLKHQFAFFGVAAPQRRKIARAVAARLPAPGEADVVAFARLAWAGEEREVHYVACDQLAAIAGRSSVALAGEVEALIRTRSWWDTVDTLASHTVGGLVQAHPQLVTVMDAWITDDDIWIARSALLHQLRYKTATDTDRLFRYCLTRAADRDFFLRKAIGWALRQYAWTDPDAVERFVAQHRAELSPLSLREATKHLHR